MSARQRKSSPAARPPSRRAAAGEAQRASAFTDSSCVATDAESALVRWHDALTVAGVLAVGAAAVAGVMWLSAGAPPVVLDVRHVLALPAGAALPGATLALVTCVGGAALLVAYCAVAGRAHAGTAARRVLGSYSPEEYAAAGVGPLPPAAAPSALYLDMVKRAVCNVLYQDRPIWFYDHGNAPMLAPAFSLGRRVRGEDVATEALSMIGMRRLDNLVDCLEAALEQGVPGDFMETGACKGGACILARAVFKAHGVTDRTVYVCDVFAPSAAPAPAWVRATFFPVLRALVAFPSRAWHRTFFRFIDRLPNPSKSFPVVANPSDQVIDMALFLMRNVDRFPPASGTSLAQVRDHFARFGLLDEQVVFLQGFFADTLPAWAAGGGAAAGSRKLAVLRCDGDTYESTMDALVHAYPRLSPGGFCIIDDYNSFSDCKTAVDEYRAKHGITEKLVPIDNLAVYWRRDE